MYYKRKIDKSIDNLREIKACTATFSEETFFSAIASKELDEEEILWMISRVRSFLPLVENEYMIIKSMKPKFVPYYTTPYNDYFGDSHHVFTKVKQSLKLFILLCSTFEQVNKKKRCDYLPPNTEPLKIYKHSWLFDPAYTPDAFNNKGYPECVYVLFELMSKCVLYIDSSIETCLCMISQVDDKRKDWEFCMDSLERFCDDINDFCNPPTLTFDINGNIIVPEETLPFFNSWINSKDKEYFASCHYHKCSIQDGYIVSNYIRQEKKRMEGYTDEEVFLFGNNPIHIYDVRLVEKNVENIFSISGTTIPSNVVNAVVSWANPNPISDEYLSMSLTHFKKTYKENGGEKTVIKLRALQNARKYCNEEELEEMHAKINRYVNRQRVFRKYN